jgi:hypothetical protein
VLALREGDAAQRRAEVDPDPLAGGSAVGAGNEAGIRHRHPAGRQAELAEPVEGPRGAGVHVVERVEVIDLGGHLRAEAGRIEPVDALDR